MCLCVYTYMCIYVYSIRVTYIHVDLRKRLNTGSYLGLLVYVCIRVCVYTYGCNTYTYMYTHIHICVLHVCNKYTYTCVYTYMCTKIHICIQVYVYIHICVIHLHMCIRVCVHTYMCSTYKHTYSAELAQSGFKGQYTNTFVYIFIHKSVRKCLHTESHEYLRRCVIAYTSYVYMCIYVHEWVWGWERVCALSPMYICLCIIICVRRNDVFIMKSMRAQCYGCNGVDSMCIYVYVYIYKYIYI